MPVFSSALSYYDSYRAETHPANLLQTQRDYFVAHTYERIDAPRGEFFYIDWPDPKRRNSGSGNGALEHFRRAREANRSCSTETAGHA